MKALKMLLSLVLSLVLVLGMACASAETIADTGLTLRNVVLNLNGQEIAFPQEARLNLLLDEESAKLGFELAEGENVFLPVSGAIDASGVRFSMGSSGRVYKLDLGVLAEEAGFDAEMLSGQDPVAVDMLEKMTGAVAGLMNVYQDPEKMAKLFAFMDGYMAVMLGDEGSDTTVTVNDVEYPARAYAGAVSAKSAMAAMDLMHDTGIEEIDAYIALTLEMMNMAMGADFTSFADMMDAMGVDPEAEEMAQEIMDAKITIANAEGMIYEAIDMDMEIEEEAAFRISAEEIFSPEAILLTMDMTGGMDEENAIDLQLAFQADLAEGAATAFEGGLSFEYGYDDGDEEYLDYESVSLGVDFSGAKENDLWKGDVGLGFESAYGWGRAEDPTEYTEAVAFNGSYAEAAEANGSITSTVDLDLDYGDLALGLQFDLNVAEGSGLADLFRAGVREYAITDDYDAAYELMEMDAAVLGADLMELSMDESVIAVMQAAESLMGYDMYEDYEEYDEYAYEDVYEDKVDTAEPEIITVSSFDEIGSLFAGEIPGFTAPEGYAFTYADVSAMDFYAVYENAEYDTVSLYVMDFGFDLGEEGSGEFTYYDDGEGNYYSADTYSGTRYISIGFDGLKLADAEAVVAGLVL